MNILLIAVVWVSAEWLRANAIRGFPWLFLGHSQSPLVVMCQVADALGVFGISFWVMLVNGLVLVTLTQRHDWRSMLPATAMTVAILLVVFAYGRWRLSQPTLAAGPRVMVVQPNHPHGRGGVRTITREVAAEFHFDATREALRGESPDLIVWSETVMPPLNPEARQELRHTAGGEFMERVHHQLADLAAGSHAAIVTGANYVAGWTTQGHARVGTEIRNAVYLYTSDGQQSATRYDKTELVLFAETLAFRTSAPWLHRLLLWLAPPVAAQPISAGAPDALTVFTIPSKPALAGHSGDNTPRSPEFRFVTPICLENIDPSLIARMFRSPAGRGKRADFLVNISNDGWFSPIERHQHLQNVIFRCIENRVPAARCVNTGISAFVDSCGRIVRTIPPGTAATATCSLMLDRRLTFYSRFGDAFAITCVLIVAVVTILKFLPVRVRHVLRFRAEVGQW